ncbi:hypothetical protein [Bermanella sp. R86510]|uniref:hypothetical protein n=1 Tax=unclassified Bermanella TaxID=2627862 RepID=UPI0037C9C4A7
MQHVAIRIRLNLWLTVILATVVIPALSHSFEMGISSAQVSPIASIYYTTSGPQVRPKGVLYTLGQYIENHTKENTRYTVIGRNQVDPMLQQGTLQSVCYTQESWHTDNETLVFTKPFMKDRNILVSINPRIKPIKSFDDLNDLSIGLIKYYVYPKLQPVLDAGTVKPVYFNREIYNVISLFRDSKIDLIMIKEATLKHFLQVMPDIVGGDKVFIHPLSMGEILVSCALSKPYKHYLPALNNAIDAYVADHPL